MIQFGCERKALSLALQRAYKLIGRSNIANIRLEVSDGILSIISTDIKNHFVQKLPVVSELSGESFFDCKNLLTVVKSIKDKEVSFSPIDEYESVINGINVKENAANSELIEMPEITPIAEISIPVSQLRKMILNTIMSVSYDPTRYFMNGCCLHYDNGWHKMIATDGKRLALVDCCCRLESDFSRDSDLRVIIPTSSAKFILDNIKANGAVTVSIGEVIKVGNAISQHIKFEFDSCTLVSQLINGSFPNYKNVIPETFDNNADIERVVLLETLERLASLAPGKKMEKLLLVDIIDNTMIVTAKDGGRIIKAENITLYRTVPELLPEISFNINPEHFIQPLKVMEDDIVTLLLTDCRHAMQLQSGSCFHIIMPQKAN